MDIYETCIYEAFYDLRSISDEVNNNAHGTEREIATQAFVDYVDFGDENTEAMTSFLESLGDLNNPDYRDGLITLRYESDFFNEVYKNVSRQSEVLEEKREFVNCELTSLIYKVGNSIARLIYQYDNGDEFVTIEYRNGHNQKVDVTADSLIALARDVLKEIH